MGRFGVEFALALELSLQKRRGCLPLSLNQQVEAFC